jgi:hypothetical protein
MGVDRPSRGTDRSVQAASLRKSGRNIRSSCRTLLRNGRLNAGARRGRRDPRRRGSSRRSDRLLARRPIPWRPFAASRDDPVSFARTWGEPGRRIGVFNSQVLVGVRRFDVLILTARKPDPGGFPNSRNRDSMQHVVDSRSGQLADDRSSRCPSLAYPEDKSGGQLSMIDQHSLLSGSRFTRKIRVAYVFVFSTLRRVQTPQASDKTARPMLSKKSHAPHRHCGRETLSSSPSLQGLVANPGGISVVPVS